jgi:hypothetical protein
MSTTRLLSIAISLGLRRDFERRNKVLFSPSSDAIGRSCSSKEKSVAPVPNHKRHPHLRLDAFVYVEEPDALAAEFAGKGVAFSSPLKDTHDGLRGFEITDRDGYVLFFGRPR